MSTALHVDGLLARLTTEPVDLVLVDLTTPRLDLAGLVARVKALSPPPALVAFGPHVHEASLATAREADCDLVLTRGQMHAQADEVIARFCGD